MSGWVRASGIVAALVVFTAASAAAQSPRPAVGTGGAPRFDPPRTPDGHPDLQGYWTNATFTPLERSAALADKAFFTEAEAAAFARGRQDQIEAQPRDNIHYDDALWQSERRQRGVSSLRTSLIVEPADGKLPPMLPEAQQRAAARQAARRAGGPADSAQARALSERCIMWPHEGPPMMPVGYNSNLQFVQGPGSVVVIQEMIHNARVIPLDARPRLGDAIRQYGGDSRGRWDGDTLVVETTNFTDKTNYRGSSERLKVTERFTMTGPDTILYRFTVEDPTTWATPWTAEYTMARTDDPIYEYACHEGNYGLANILRAQRVADEEAARAAERSSR